MQGQRTDYSYDRILRFIQKNEPISVKSLHEYLYTRLNILLSVSRSRVINKLIKTGKIERTAGKTSRNSFFQLTSDKTEYNEKK
jgi:hypothetical protein